MCFILDLHSLKEENIHLNLSCQYSISLLKYHPPVQKLNSLNNNHLEITKAYTKAEDNATSSWQ